jgi:hypothetical protein
MVRRNIALLALALATFAAACTSPTAPKNDCTVNAGSGVCQQK